MTSLHLPFATKKPVDVSLLDAGLTPRERFWGLTALALYWLALLALPVLMIATPMLARAADGSFRVTLADAEKAVAQTLEEEGVGQKVRVSLQSLGIRNPLATYEQDIKVYVQHLQLDKDRSRLEATLVFEADGVQLAPMEISGRYESMQPVPVLNRAVRNGQVISAEDITMRDEIAARIRPNTVIDQEELIGKTALRTISPSRMIRTDELASPAIVSKGQQITLRYVAHNLEIKSAGEVLDNGAIGDLVRVRNQDSKQIIQGTVQDGHTITIYAPSATRPQPAALAANIAAPLAAQPLGKPALVKTAAAEQLALRNQPQTLLAPELPDTIPNQGFADQPANVAQETALIDPLDLLEKHHDAN